ncbi:FAD-dependent thymidylate synthase [Aneurinibacillus sp. Ricciae_BoGa-3]|uniref:FAD-dependent thymidylate synthase n=1 Tax=Aneurinibacillus sp. Ricciae_BoGa-3 TaxID=3022697 RepID=UPI00234093E1|nr:FAD-dependent thymidylate synthase [Aneurinibacillus sp. Ricciae_BoGa-3]WCK53936.1 FAD-dependent thymidylate synthase [Aneurinibacillus sp. Ricciae_BoGa-3]
MDGLKNYVTSTEDNVYAIKNVPTEVAGAVFAKVSRSPKSFRDNLFDLIKEDMLRLPDVDMIAMFKDSAAHAGGFMKKWGVDYGHSSIKEHAFAQFCIEGVSRWFTEALETVQAAKWLSFTEFSLRYQKPQDFVVPAELDMHPELKQKFVSFGESCFQKYEELVPLFFSLIKAKNPDMKDGAAEKLAYENARNVLPLATKSNVAVTGNARAISDAIAELLSHEGFNQEFVVTAEKIKKHTTDVLPSLISHTEATPFMRSYTTNFYRRRHTAADLPIYSGPFLEVQENAAHLEYQADAELNLGELGEMNRFSELPATMRAFGKMVAVTCSEGCHHQIIRHRAFDFQIQLPDTAYGFILPIETVGAAGKAAADQINEILLTMRARSHELYEELHAVGLPGIAPYAVLNGNARRLPFYANMYGLAHFVSLRKEEYAQDEIRSVAAQLERVFAEEEAKLAGFNLDRHLRK